MTTRLKDRGVTPGRHSNLPYFVRVVYGTASGVLGRGGPCTQTLQGGDQWRVDLGRDGGVSEKSRASR